MLNTEEMGKRIKELRIEKGWTGIKMSTRIGIDKKSALMRCAAQLTRVLFSYFHLLFV